MNEPNPYSSPTFNETAPVHEQPVSYFKAWIIFFLVAIVLGFFVGVVAGGLLGVVMATNGFEQQQIYLAGQGVGFLIGIPISFLTYRWSVKQFIVDPLKARMQLKD